MDREEILAAFEKGLPTGQKMRLTNEARDYLLGNTGLMEDEEEAERVAAVSARMAIRAGREVITLADFIGGIKEAESLPSDGEMILSEPPDIPSTRGERADNFPIIPEPPVEATAEAPEEGAPLAADGAADKTDVSASPEPAPAEEVISEPAPRRARRAPDVAPTPEPGSAPAGSRTDR